MRSAVDVSTLDACESTNAVLLARARAAELARPAVLRARLQTAGRGRHGRAWRMEPGVSLAFSIAWPVRAVPEALSLALGAALADALEPPASTAPRIGLKWPNDLLLDGRRKLAGILVEAVPGIAVAGIGLNVRPLAVPDASQGVASLSELQAAATPDSVFDTLWPRLVEALARFEAHGFAAGFAQRFAARDVLAGSRVRATVAGGRIEGLADGVDGDGALRLRTPAGTARVTTGEVVSLRPAMAEVVRC
jgi:BirA family biotin operon repressor/biotin-[acetyl-CoA-carboxylase] ligase